MSGAGTGPDRPLIHTALSAVMQDVQVVRKDSRNSAQGFNFRGIDAVLNAVGPALRRHGVICLPTVVSMKHRDFTSKNGTLQHEAIVEVAYAFVASDGSELTCSVVGEASDASDKATTQAMSVAYRTALLQALCLPTDAPDPDEHTTDRIEGDVVADATAVLDGWGGGIPQRDRAWTDLVRQQLACEDEAIVAAVVDWGRAEQLSPDTLTPEQAKTWQTMLEGDIPF